MNIKRSQIDNIEIDWNGQPDYPDFTEAFISSCDIDGVEATDEEVDWINDNLSGEFYDTIFESLIS